MILHRNHIRYSCQRRRQRFCHIDAIKKKWKIEIGAPGIKERIDGKKRGAAGKTGTELCGPCGGCPVMKPIALHFAHFAIRIFANWQFYWSSRIIQRRLQRRILLQVSYLGTILNAATKEEERHKIGISNLIF